MLNLLFVSLLALAGSVAQGQTTPDRPAARETVPPKCSAYQGRQREECIAKELHPAQNAGPSTKGVEIDEAHRTAPENKAGSGKSSANGGASETQDSSTQGRAPTAH